MTELPYDFKCRMKEMLKDEYEEFIKAFENQENYVGLRLNRRKENTEELFENILHECERVEWCSDGYYCKKEIISGNHPYHLAGLCYFQEPSAMSSVECMEIKPDDYVLDLCAAPGGKASQAGLKLSEQGLLLANEIIPKRALVLAENIERMGISNAIVTNESPERLAEKFEDFFDKIIVDAPCSGEGMFRKEPRAAEEWSINHTKTCAIRQRHILDCAYRMLREGGCILYSTCTFAPCENEENVEYMLSAYKDLTLSDTGLDMLESGRTEWSDGSHDMTPARRIFPHKHKGEGHFSALLKKGGNAVSRQTAKFREDKKCAEGIALFKNFEKNSLNTDINGCFKMHGDNLYLVPHGIDTDKLKLVRGGLHLGVCRKNRFEPSHALLMTLNAHDFKNILSFSVASPVLNRYLHGDVIESDFSGYAAVAVENNPIGWAKGSCGVLKNHYPKHLRLV